MKKLIMLVVIFIIATFFIIGNKKENEHIIKKDTKPIQQEETRAIYVSYIELDEYIKDKTEEVSKKNIETIVKNIKDNKYDTIILQVRPFSDAIYPSKIYPISNSILNNNGDAPNYDVLDYFIKLSHENNIKLHAWINPYRISNDTDTSKIDKKSINYKYLNTTHVSIIKDKGIYYNPASNEVKNLILKGIKELVENYDVDGVHLDDYFYPDKNIDKENYEIYKAAGGTLSIEQYRLENTTSLIKDIYTQIKTINKNIEFGIAPEGNLDNNYTSNYIDTKKILSKEGYVDYIMPQIYFGFENEVRPFIKTIEEWSNLIKVNNIKLIPALALYKSGTVDSYAKSGENEWINNQDIIKRQIIISRNMKHYDGFSIFRYDYLFNKSKINENLEQEINNLNSLLRK